MASITLAGNVGAGDVYAGNTFYPAPSAALTVTIDAQYLNAFLIAGYKLAGATTDSTADRLTTPRTIDGQSFDGSANIAVIAPGTHAATGKTTPVNADEMPLVDSAAANVLKKVTWANIKATLKAYFDTLYCTGFVYAGFVGSNGTTGNVLPAGWTAASGSTGVYTITHGLALSGAQRLAITATVVDASGLTDLPIVVVTLETANATTLKIVSAVAVPALLAADFYFQAKVV